MSSRSSSVHVAFLSGCFLKLLQMQFFSTLLVGLVPIPGPSALQSVDFPLWCCQSGWPCTTVSVSTSSGASSCSKILNNPHHPRLTSSYSTPSPPLKNTFITELHCIFATFLGFWHNLQHKLAGHWALPSAKTASPDAWLRPDPGCLVGREGHGMNDMKSLELASKVGDHPQKHPSRIKSMYRFVYIYIYTCISKNLASIHSIHNFDFRSLKLPFQQLLFPQFRGGWPPGHIQQNLEKNKHLSIAINKNRLRSTIPVIWNVDFPKVPSSNVRIFPKIITQQTLPYLGSQDVFWGDPEGFFP